VPIVIGTVLTTPLALVIVSVTTTPVRSAVPQLETEPETVNEPAERSIVAGPQTLLTWIHAVFVTSVTQVPDVLDAGPHGPSPVTVKKSLLGPQLVTVIVWVGTGTAVWAATVPMVIGRENTTPLALVMVSKTTTFVSGSEPQLVTEPETV
jgi:hypothetical protein